LLLVVTWRQKLFSALAKQNIEAYEGIIEGYLVHGKKTNH
jgi:hypothetical protein